MNRRSFISSGAGALMMAACTKTESTAAVLPTDGRIRSGGARMIEIEGGYHVWTKKVGDAPIKLLLLHGGPGVDHSYFECFEDFLPQNGIEFYYYDQLDSTYSDKPNDPKLWTLERFRDEVESVRKGLGLEGFYLLGHSWGGILGIEYALAYPEHLKGLIISNMPAGVRSAEVYARSLRAELPPDTQAILDKYEREGKFDAPEYQRVMMDVFYTRHLCRLPRPWPEPMERIFRHFNRDIYNYMQGPNVMSVTGTLKNWDRWADLPRIRTRTLTIGAKYDEMPPEEMRKMATLMPNARSWISDKGAHMTMWDDQLAYVRTVIDFLKSA
ncbi:proline iminopeptidase-family hydrolase [Pendulispora brunnea]|uniref:Proline iminopeptidase-family hydrolase n=1 Tax=Pendulispora brunnea TaxID=2905690 RepID=A0ABZ2K843_9BACT